MFVEIKSLNVYFCAPDLLTFSMIKIINILFITGRISFKNILCQLNRVGVELGGAYDQNLWVEDCVLSDDKLNQTQLNLY